ncbi:myb-like protein AA [Mugil cephalus]|uniref:myb-like protein AA n=1 Tax=Mugil cephalus TaxID=48193 RepID=UPI001FB7C490|nr:myb-like protein AA [Mugil cephalus]
MSAATASIADVSRTENTGRPQAQCTPMPLPALGTQRIIQGNGTNVGTVISLQCPAKHKLVGELTCVMDTNRTHWVGETYCEPLTTYNDFGFRVAVLASIVSTAIIMIMSVAFITCCLLDCIKAEERKRQEKEVDMWQWEEDTQRSGDNRSRYGHKGRNGNNNNNNNNSNNSQQQRMLSLWDTRNPALGDSMQPCRCQQQYIYSPACTYVPPPPLSALPGHGYDQPLLPQNPESDPPQYPGPPLSPYQTASSGLVPVLEMGSGSVWQYGGQQSRSPLNKDESSMRNINSNRNVNRQEFPIRIISV